MSHVTIVLRTRPEDPMRRTEATNAVERLWQTLGGPHRSLEIVAVDVKQRPIARINRRLPLPSAMATIDPLGDAWYRAQRSPELFAAVYMDMPDPFTWETDSYHDDDEDDDGGDCAWYGPGRISWQDMSPRQRFAATLAVRIYQAEHGYSGFDPTIESWQPEFLDAAVASIQAWPAALHDEPNPTDNELLP